MTDVSQRLTRLEATLANQTAELERLRADLASATAGASPDPTTPAAVGTTASSPTGTASTRRTLFKTGAIAAGAALAGSMAMPKPAAATDGTPLEVGANNTTAAGNTRLVAGTGARLSNANILTVSDGLTSSAYEAAIGGVAQGGRVTNGLYGYTEARDDTDIATGHAVVARKASGGRAHIYMPPSSGAPTSETYRHARGELRADFSGALWYCVATGTPGVWRRLASPTSSGAVHAIAPSRTYDSRFVDGPLAGGADRLVSVADRIDVATGAIVQFNLVPAGATAVFFNVTITSTVGQGFLTVSPGDATAIAASTINWSVAGLTAANASVSTLDSDRQLRVFAGGDGATTEFIVDVTGYTI